MRVRLIQPDDAAAEELSAGLLEHGHEPAEDGERLDACLVYLVPDADASLAALAKAIRAPTLRQVPLLFAGGGEDALLTAQDAYPSASFVRIDQVFTALASLNA